MKSSRRQFLGQALTVGTAGALTGCATTQDTNVAKATAGPEAAARPRRVLGANDRIRCGIVGAGGRGSGLLQETLRRDDVDVVSVCDAYATWRDRAATWCREEYPAVTSYVHFDEMYTTEELDSVIIATPDHIHADAAIAALNLGMAVYVEKPMTLTWETAAALRDAARRNESVVQVGTQLRSTDIYRRAQEAVQSGLIGTLVEVQVNRHAGDGMVTFNQPPVDANESNVDWEAFLHGTKRYRFEPRRFFQWRQFEEYSNGVTGDLMMHHLDACHFITGCGMPERAMSIGGIYHFDDGRTCADTVSSLFAYSEGFHFNYTTTLVNGHYGLVERYLGSDGVLEITGMGSLKVIKRDYENVYESEGPDTRSHIANFFECVRSRQPTIATVDDGFRGAACCHMAVESERTGEAVHWNAGKEEISTRRSRRV